MFGSGFALSINYELINILTKYEYWILLIILFYSNPVINLLLIYGNLNTPIS